MSPITMRLRILAFGSLKERLPLGGMTRAVPTGATVASLLDALQTEGTFPAEVLRSAAVAVNQEYAKGTRTLADGDEVALLPPVSGGSEQKTGLVREPIISGTLLNAVKAGEDGAVVVFDGIVRNNTRGRETLHLDYEAYEDMALKQMRDLRIAALERFGIRDVVLVHRLGRLYVGETSVFIAVVSAHRGPAFEACRWMIDTLKKTVPIWKREQFADGAVWADGEPFPEELLGAGK